MQYVRKEDGRRVERISVWIDLLTLDPSFVKAFIDKKKGEAKEEKKKHPKPASPAGPAAAAKKRKAQGAQGKKAPKRKR